MPYKNNLQIVGQPLVLRRAGIDELIDLRHVVLRAGLPRDSAFFSGDDVPSSRHYGAFIPGAAVACATVHRNSWQHQPAWQLRGMATAPAVRGGGVGRAILQFLEDDLRHGAQVLPLWCNARVPAVGFYRRMGWVVVSDVFDIPTAGPHVQMTRVL